MSWLNLSIDLSAEIGKITSRQHLNDVHYLVQLVRHALTREPPSIHISLKPGRVVIEHEGMEPSAREMNLLWLLLHPEVRDEERQVALVELEKNYGIALLSLFRTFPRVTLSYRFKRIIFAQGEYLEQDSDEDRDGYRLEIDTQGKSIRREKEELVFFCGACTVPIYLDGKKLANRIQLKNQFFTLKFQTEAGEGMVGLPLHDTYSSIHIFKQGVKVGTQRLSRGDGLVFHGYWNTYNHEFETDYSKTTKEGHDLLFEQAETLYEQLADHYSNMSREQKLRVRQLIMRQDLYQWEQLYYDLPVFRSANGKQHLTFDDLMAVHEMYRNLPYTSKPNPKVPNYLPCLSHDEVGHLEHAFGWIMSPAREEPFPANWRRLKKRSLPEGLPASRELGRLLTLMNTPTMHFRLGNGPIDVCIDSWDRYIIYIPERDERLMATLEHESIDKRTVSQLRQHYRRLALAKADADQ